MRRLWERGLWLVGRTVYARSIIIVISWYGEFKYMKLRLEIPQCGVRIAELSLPLGLWAWRKILSLRIVLFGNGSPIAAQQPTA